jgi:hypothetical protein
MDWYLKLGHSVVFYKTGDPTALYLSLVTRLECASPFGFASLTFHVYTNPLFFFLEAEVVEATNV